MTADPRYRPPIVNAISTAIIATAISVAEPRSFHRRLDRRHHGRPYGDARQQDRISGDGRNNEPAFPTEVELGTGRRDVLRGLCSAPVITARREAGRLPGRIDAPRLHGQGGEPGRAQHQNDHQRGDGESRLDGGGAAITGQTLVFSARLMMFVSAETIESPVTTA